MEETTAAACTCVLCVTDYIAHLLLLGYLAGAVFVTRACEDHLKGMYHVNVS
jgi:hypothetical protein